MIDYARNRIRSARVIFRTTASLVGTAVANGLVGFGFWWVAARLYSPESVGLAASAIAAMMFLGRISQAGLGTTLIGELPGMESGRRRLIATSLIATMALGVAVGGLFAVIAPIFAPPLEVIGGDALRIGIFAGGVGLTAAAGVLDYVLVALLKGGVQLARNLVFSIGKLLLLIPAGIWLVMDGIAIYAVWALGVVLSFGFMALLVRRNGISDGWRPLVWNRIARLSRGAMMHHLVNVSRFAPDSILPIVVTTLLSSSANAAFYVALMLSNYVTLVGQSASLTLFAVAARDPGALWHQLRMTMALSIIAASGGAAGLWLLGEPLLHLFGEAYADVAYPAIAILALRGLPMMLKDHWVAIQRIRRGMGTAAVLTWTAVGLEVGLAMVGASVAGLVGLAWGWFAALVIEALVLFVPVMRAARAPRPADPVTPVGPMR